MVFENGQGDKVNPVELQDSGLNTAVLFQDRRTEPPTTRMETGSKSLPGLIIESIDQVQMAERNALSGVAEKSNTEKAVASIEKGDFGALQQQMKDLAKGDRANSTQNMPLLIYDIKKQTGIDVSFTNAEMTVTAKLTDKETGRKDVISVSLLADGTKSVATYEKGGVEQKEFPSVEEATKMIMKNVNNGAAKGIIDEVTKGDAAKGLSKAITDELVPKVAPWDLERPDFEEKEPGIFDRIAKEIEFQRAAHAFAKMLMKPELSKDDLQFLNMEIGMAHEAGRLKDFAKAVNDRVKAIDPKMEFVMNDKHANIRDVGIVSVELKRDGKVIAAQSFYTDNGLKVWHPTYRPKSK